MTARADGRESHPHVTAATLDERLAQTFVELADTLVARHDLKEFLQTFTDRCVGLLELDAAGLLLADSRGPDHDRALMKDSRSSLNVSL